MNHDEADSFREPAGLSDEEILERLVALGLEPAAAQWPRGLDSCIRLWRTSEALAGMTGSGPEFGALGSVGGWLIVGGGVGIIARSLWTGFSPFRPGADVLQGDGSTGSP